MAIGVQGKRNKPTLANVLVFLAIALVLGYIADRYVGALVAHISFNNAADVLTQSPTLFLHAITTQPFTLSLGYWQLIAALLAFLVVWIVYSYIYLMDHDERVGEEHGSARWARPAELRRFQDLVHPDRNLLFSKQSALALKVKERKDERNWNVAVVGGSGTGKTRYYVKPNLMQLNSDYIVTDPKGTIIQEVGHLYEDEGWDIRSFNVVDFAASAHYNPLRYLTTDAEVMSFVKFMITNTNGDKQGGGSDPFWEQSETLLYTALILYLRDWADPEDYSLSGLLTLLSWAKASDENESFKSRLDYCFDEIRYGRIWERGEEGTTPSGNTSVKGAVQQASGRAYVPFEATQTASQTQGKPKAGVSYKPSTLKRRSDGMRPYERYWKAKYGEGEVDWSYASAADDTTEAVTTDEDQALHYYEAFRVAAGKTLKSIIVSCNARLAPIVVSEVRELLSYDEMGLDRLGRQDKDSRPNVIFAVPNDTDHTYSFLVGMLLWQTLNITLNTADFTCKGRLPRHVQIIFDEFATIGKMPEVEDMAAVVRSRNIGLTFLVQDIMKVQKLYSKEIVSNLFANCDTKMFIGGMETETNKFFSEMMGKETIHTTSHSKTPLITMQNQSGSDNQSVIGRDLMDASELGRMDNDYCVVLIRGNYPLYDLKYPLEEHPRYRYVVDGQRGAKYTENFDYTAYRDRRRQAKSAEGQDLPPVPTIEDSAADDILANAASPDDLEGIEPTSDMRLERRGADNAVELPTETPAEGRGERELELAA